jgi:hypothetical protein
MLYYGFDNQGSTQYTLQLSLTPEYARTWQRCCSIEYYSIQNNLRYIYISYKESGLTINLM